VITSKRFGLSPYGNTPPLNVQGRVAICFYRNWLRGCRAVRGQNGGLTLTFHSRPYNRSALLCVLPVMFWLRLVIFSSVFIWKR